MHMDVFIECRTGLYVDALSVNHPSIDSFYGSIGSLASIYVLLTQCRCPSLISPPISPGYFLVYGAPEADFSS